MIAASAFFAGFPRARERFDRLLAEGWPTVTSADGYCTLHPRDDATEFVLKFSVAPNFSVELNAAEVGLVVVDGIVFYVDGEGVTRG